MNGPHATWLTREAFDRLKRELNRLIANRPTIAAEISARREEGDLRENDAYRAIREEQVKEEGRIRQLQQLLRDARIEERPRGGGVAEPGMVLTVAYEDAAETETFLLATRAAGAHEEIEVYSPESPLGHALLGAREGDTRVYELPRGGTMRVTLVKAEPYRG
ncbi:transcription elongation factor GreA [Saccharopolyspora thermophila]|uniref:transcription elongation factor GreA n=1 Tax=Saccharopolyspora thermophila TaxID=89367 RepID=UPI001E405589|nr:transcription elongation factor GreA [Saccharopolyspora subtropica]